MSLFISESNSVLEVKTLILEILERSLVGLIFLQEWFFTPTWAMTLQELWLLWPVHIDKVDFWESLRVAQGAGEMQVFRQMDGRLHWVLRKNKSKLRFKEDVLALIIKQPQTAWIPRLSEILSGKKYFSFRIELMWLMFRMMTAPVRLSLVSPKLA